MTEYVSAKVTEKPRLVRHQTKPLILAMVFALGVLGMVWAVMDAEDNNNAVNGPGTIHSHVMSAAAASHDYIGVPRIHPVFGVATSPARPPVPSAALNTYSHTGRPASQNTTKASWCLSIHGWNLICTTQKTYGNHHDKQ
ncbi:hypothetical protein [Acidithiobacillus sp.]|jgi:hypothetical protein|uniref:hypothetical protein n=1 Tax=Acidithiobacillus sp. TaxID=1872118 RepID=UPI00356905BE